jgi:hypothetical protein
MSIIEGFSPIVGTGQEDIQVLVRRIARELGVDEELAYELVKRESNFNPRAVSHAGAVGLAQLMPDTARELGLNESNWFDPEQNVRAGLGYYKQQLERFGTPELALAAYNAGPGNVRKHGGVPPFDETQKYVSTIQGNLKKEPAPTGAIPGFAAPSAEPRLEVGGPTPTRISGFKPPGPLVGSPEHSEMMRRGGALPAMRDLPQEGEVMPGYEVHTDPQEGREMLQDQVPVKVAQHIDADSMYVSPLHSDEVWEIRLQDVNAPEWDTEHGEAAKQVVESLAPIGSTLILETNWEAGRKGRLVGKMYSRQLDKTIDISVLDVGEGKPGDDPGHIKGFGAGVGKMGTDIIGLGLGAARGVGALVPGGRGPLEAFGSGFETMEGTAFGQAMVRTRDDYIAAAEGDKWIPVPLTDEGNGPLMVSFNELLRMGTYMGGEFLDIWWAAGRKGLTKLLGIANKYNAAKLAGNAATHEGDKLLRVSKEVAALVDEDAAVHELAGRYMDVMEEIPEVPTAIGRLGNLMLSVVDHFSEKEAVLTKWGGPLARYIQRNRAAARIAQSSISNQAAYFDEALGETVRLGESFRDIWAGVSQKEMIDADMYMSFERLVKDIAPDDELAKKLGMTKESLADGKRILGHIERKYGTRWNIMRDRIDRHYQWRRNATLIPLEKLGILDAKTLKEISERYAHYSPYFRKATDPILEAIEKAGGDEALKDILTLEGHIGTMTQGIEKAMVLPQGEPIKALHKALDPKAKIASGIRSDLIRAQSIGRWIEAQRVRNQLARVIEANPESFMRDVAKVGHGGHKLKGYKNTFTSYKGGEATHWYVKDKRLIEALDSLSSAQAGMLQKILENKFAKPVVGASSLFRKGVVLGLEFMFRNPIRDQFSAGLFTKYGYNPFLTFFSGLFHTISRDEVWRRFHESGASMSVWESLDVPIIDHSIRNINWVGHTYSEKAVARARGVGLPSRGAGGKYKANRWSNSMKNWVAESGAEGATSVYKLPFHGLQRVSEILEEATRVGAFGKAMKRHKKGIGYTPMVALDKALGGLPGLAKTVTSFGRNLKGFTGRYRAARKATGELDWMDEAREITLDFSRRGHFGELMNGLIPFANAELQDVSRFYRAMRDQPLTTLTRGFAFMTVPAIVNWLKNHDNPDYRSMGETERSLFFHFLPLSDKYQKFLRIPRPVGSPQVFMGWGIEKMLDWMLYNDRPAVKKLSEMMYPGQAPTGDSDAFEEWANTLAQTGPLKYLYSQANLMPQAISPLIQLWANKDSFFGGPVVPRYMSDAGERLPEDVYYESTNQIMEPTSQAIRNVGNLTKFPWLESMNPMQAEFLFRKYTGSVGGMLIESAERAMEVGGMPGVEERPGMPRDITTAPLAKGFFSRSPWGPSSDAVEDFYNHYAESRRAYNSMRDMVENANRQGMDRVESRNPEWQAYEFMNQASKDLTEIWNLRKQVVNDKRIEDTVRRDRLLWLDQYASQYARMVVDSYREFMLNPFGVEDEQR